MEAKHGEKILVISQIFSENLPSFWPVLDRLSISLNAARLVQKNLVVWNKKS